MKFSVSEHCCVASLTASFFGRGVLKNWQGFSTKMGPPSPGLALKNQVGFSTNALRVIIPPSASRLNNQPRDGRSGMGRNLPGHQWKNELRRASALGPDRRSPRRSSAGKRFPHPALTNVDGSLPRSKHCIADREQIADIVPEAIRRVSRKRPCDICRRVWRSAISTHRILADYPLERRSHGANYDS